MGGVQDDTVNTVSIYKNGQMVLSKAAVQKLDFDGKLVDLVYDQEKRALGWKVLPIVIGEDKWSKTMRMLMRNDKGTIKIAVGKILKAVGVEKMNFLNLEIEKYQDQMEHREIYYIIIPNEKEKS